VGGSVRRADGDDGHLGVAEGIETALSAQAMFGVPTWAALSADGLRRWQWPSGISRVTIFADAGDAGAQAATVLAERLSAAGIANAVAPLHGDDFDDLRHGVTAAEYEISAPVAIRRHSLPRVPAGGRGRDPPGDALETCSANSSWHGWNPPARRSSRKAAPASPSPSSRSRSQSCAAG
jgi:hypothetical protein